MLKFLDIFFVVFHASLIVFNLFGWIWRKTGVLNLITLLLTGFSWFILGIFYGIGYCPLTDWHFQVLEKLGVRVWTDSYVQYLIKRLFNLYIPENIVNIITVAAFFAALMVSLYVNIFKHRVTSEAKIK